jgi:hypothetical protein
MNVCFACKIAGPVCTGGMALSMVIYYDFNNSPGTMADRSVLALLL